MNYTFIKHNLQPSELVLGDFECTVKSFTKQWRSGGILGCHRRNWNS